MPENKNTDTFSAQKIIENIKTNWLNILIIVAAVIIIVLIIKLVSKKLERQLMQELVLKRLR